MLSAGIQVKPALGGISSIFESVQHFTASDLQLAKESLVKPRPAAVDCTCKYRGLPMQIALEAALVLPRPLQRPGLLENYYGCPRCNWLSPNYKGSACQHCKSFGYPDQTNSQGPYSAFPSEPGHHTGGFVRGNTTFIITDSLEIMPLTTIRSVSVLSRLNVASLFDLEGNNITVSLRQILQLLHSSLTSNTCLNEVFGN